MDQPCLLRNEPNMCTSLGKLREFMTDREAWRAAIHGVTKSRTRLSDWTELKMFASAKLCWAFRVTLMLGKIEGGRRRGRQRMRWLGGIPDLLDMSKLPGHSEGHGTINGVSKSWTRCSDWTTTIRSRNRALVKESLLVAQLCPTFCDPMDCSPPGSSVHGILQATMLEWVAIPFSSVVFPTQGLNLGLLHCLRSFTVRAPREALSQNIVVTICSLSNTSSLLGKPLSCFSGITYETRPNLDFLQYSHYSFLILHPALGI